MSAHSARGGTSMIRLIGVAAHAAIVALALAATASGGVGVTIQALGLDPTVTFVQDDGVDWWNSTDQTQAIVSADGRFDSGPIPPGGGYSLHLPQPGDYPYTVWPAGFAGSLSVARPLIGGDPRDFVSDHIPDLPFPEDPPSDRAPDPVLGIRTSKSRIMVLFRDDARVAAANAALTRAGVEIVGGLPRFGVVLVQSQPPDSGLSDGAAFARRDAALGRLRSDESVEAAAMDADVKLDAVPHPAAFSFTQPPIGGTFAAQWIWGEPGLNGQDYGGDNWYLEADRAPQAWNLLQAIRAKKALVDSVVLDQPVDVSHSNLRHVVPEQLCTPFLVAFARCTETDPKSHGTHVAGTMAGSYDNGGADGIDPVASVHSVGFSFGLSFGEADDLQIFDLILNEATGGRFPNLRVINYSAGVTVPTRDNLRSRHTVSGVVVANCGPGPDDDGQPGSTEDCSLNNDDAWQTEFAQLGTIARSIAEAASDANVMIVQAAGNDSNDYCIPLEADPPLCKTQDIDAASVQEFIWATQPQHWNSPRPNPVIGVEAVDKQPGDTHLIRAPFSNLNFDDISAPGVDIVNSDIGGGYTSKDGTSMAAPQVSGAIAYLLAYKPTLSIDEVRAALFDWAAHDTVGAAAPRLDLFASLMSLPDAADDLVDVNDRSRDGDNNLTIQPDGRVDMRDFRAFRDAWLVSCGVTGRPNCPDVADVNLVGEPEHRKDLNQDGCVRLEPANTGATDFACPSSDDVFSRFDFNGNGIVSSDDTSAMPFDADGNPVDPPGSDLTDLQVMQSQWPLDDDKTEGWKKSDLDELMKSGDLEIHADDLFKEGASDVKVEMTSSDGTALPDRHIKPDLKPEKSFIVATVPADPANQTKIKVTASATIAGETIKTTPVEVALKIGEDQRVDLCKGLTVTATPSQLTADGKQTSKVVAQLHKCSDIEIANRPIAFALDHTSGGASITLTDGVTKADGAASAVFTAGTATDTYKVKATVTLDDGLTETAEATIKVRPPLKIAYVWKQHVESWSDGGSTKWPAPTRLMPDCTIPGVIDYCVDSFDTKLTSETNGGIERSGTLDGGGSDFKVTEQVTNSLGRSHRQWHLTLTSGQTETFSGDASWQVTDPTAYADKALTGVKATFGDDGIHVAGMQTVGDLPYHYALSEQHPPGTQLDPRELAPMAAQAFLLVPHTSEGPIRFAGRPGTDIVFPFDAAAQTYLPYQSCGVLDEAGVTQPGYFVERPNPYVAGFETERVDTYEPGAHPAPVGPRTLKASYSFGAVVTVGDGPVTTPTLPDCTTSHAPVPKFDAPAETLEGRQTHFVDRSTDVDDDITSWHWDFGDGKQTSSEQNPYHMFPDNGTYDVTLTVTDDEGKSASTTKTIAVANQPPLAYIDDATAEEGQPLTFNWGIWDAGKIDRDQITWVLTSTNADWPLQSNTEAAFDGSVTVEHLPVGVYPMTLTVIDKDGDSSTAEATFEVTEGPPPVCDPVTGENCPPVPPTPPYVVCDGSATLDAEEQAFLDLVNLYRIQNGLSPLGVSPTLQTAAGVHAHDMAVNDFMSHVGSDGSQPWDRAWKAGYPKTAGIGENIASQAETGFQVMWAWKSSPPHNANMLNPAWNAIGIAREQGNQWRWATSFGTELDCPSTASAAVAAAAAPKAAPRSLASVRTTARTPIRGVRINRRVWNVHRAPLHARHRAARHARHRRHHLVRRSRHVLTRRLAQTAGAEDVGFGPGAAFTISNVSPMAGKPLRLTNRSRDADGQPIAATADFGDGTAPVSLAADASTVHSFPRPWEEYDIALTAVDASGSSTTVDRKIFPWPLPQPLIAYNGPAVLSAATRHFTAGATVRDPTGAPLAGVPVTFTLEDATAVGTTDVSGSAQVTLDVAGLDPGDDHLLTISFAGNADYGARDEVASIFVVRMKPDLTYTGSLNGAVGKTLAVGAKLLDPSTKEPIVGAQLTFTLLTSPYPNAIATTDASGAASATLDLTGISSGAEGLMTTFAGSADYEIEQAFTNVTITRNTAPVANAGGPYVLGVGGTLLLDGGLSTDPDPGDGVASWNWDLNRDGATDVTGVTPRALGWSELQTLLCTVACAANVDYSIGLTVTDTRGEKASATTTVRFASDFALLLGGGTTTVVPGQSNSVAVTVVGSSDFHSPVTLATVGLPSGVTARFSTNPVTPPGISVLTLTAASTAQAGTSPIRITGTANGVTHEVSEDVKVAFGLVPVCYGTAEGTVVDDAGAPISGATVSNFFFVTDTTDANGRFTLRNLPLGVNNSPSTVNVLATKDGYWQTTASAPVYCGATTHVALTMLASRTGRVSGIVHEGTADTSGQIVTPTAATIPTASIQFVTGPTALADANGAYAADLALNQNNSPRAYGATAHAPGYWEQTKSVLAEASAPKQLDFALVKQCHGTLVGGTLQFEDESPAAAHTVGIDEFGNGFTAVTTMTDSQGNFTFERDELLGYNNVPRDYTLIAYGSPLDPPGMQTQRLSWPLTGCGDRSSRIFRLRLPPATHGAIDGVVRDEETGFPIAGATVSGYTDFSLPGNTSPGTATTDANGHYHVDNVLIGYGTSTAFRFVAATRDGYYSSQTAVTLAADATTTVNLALLRKRTGAVNGHVRDAVSGAPIAGASVEGGFRCSIVCTTTDGDGLYAATNIALGARNAAVSGSVTASADDYWPQSKIVRVVGDTATTTDFDLIRKCTPAKIVGLVLDASTQQPIEHAQISANARLAFTNASGRFELADVEPGPANAPLQVTLTASAPGFISQSKTVTIFCGATIVVDFGTRQSALGVIVGRITDADTGTALANVFVGSEFGGAATTDANGNYRFANVPLGEQDGDRTWTVTAMPAGYAPITKTIIARANVEVRADFAFSKLANHPPIASDGTVTTSAGIATAVVLHASDPDGDALVYSVVVGPAHGVLTGIAPALTYTPDAGYAGPDSFTFKASDGRLDSNVATVSVTVAGTSRAPVAVDDEASTHANVPLALDPTANDDDPDGDPIQVVATSLTAPAHGTLTLDGNSVTYTPDDGFVGNDGFRYRVTDGLATSEPATVTVRVTNSAPVAQSAALALDEDTEVALAFAASDSDGDPTTFTIVGGSEHGTAADGRYTPAVDYFGSDTIVYTANDGFADSPPATIEITVRPVNDAPRPADDHAMTAEDTRATLDVLANDTAGPANESDQKLALASVAVPVHGTATVAGTDIRYEPDANFNGTDTFGYRACDDVAIDPRCAEGTVTIVVTPVNDPPAVTLAPALVDEGSAVALDADASDPDGDSLTYSWGSDLGIVAPDADPSNATFTADDGPATAHVTLTVSDGSLEAGATTEVTVLNADPTAVASATPSKQYWGLPVHFIGSATDPSRADAAAGLDQSWSFGDGATSFGGEASHAFAQPGRYTATFAVRDKDGDADSATVEVGVERRESRLTYTGSPTIDANGEVVLSARLSDPVDNATADLAGHDVVFTIGGKTFVTTTDASGLAAVTEHPTVEPSVVTMTFAGDGLYGPAQAEKRIDFPVVFGDGSGFFAVGPSSAAVGRTITFWSSSWAAANLTPAPPSFKGFVASLDTPVCGAAWTSRPGNSSDPPRTVPRYLAVVVTRALGESHSVLFGDVAHIAIVKTAAGYGPSPGHHGVGQVVSIVC